MPSDKPFSQSCENNKSPILQIIRKVFVRPVTVWEIGSGTGQHACFFARELPHLTWQPTDRSEYLPGIQRWVADAKLSNLKPPLALDVTHSVWPCTGIEALFSANTLHIMSMAEVAILFERLSVQLNPAARFCVYGPFNYGGHYTSDSNAGFDAWLKTRNPLSGIRDFEWICTLAAAANLQFLQDHAMPANNRLLVFQKIAQP